MTVFLDAGLFIGALYRGDPRHEEAKRIVEAARQGNLSACTSAGVLSEVYAALTWIGAKPPQTPKVAAYSVDLLVKPPSGIRILETNLEVSQKMLEMAGKQGLTARRIHDARHAATALVSGIVEVYTYDVEDWKQFEADGIVIVGPDSVLADK